MRIVYAIVAVISLFAGMMLGDLHGNAVNSKLINPPVQTIVLKPLSLPESSKLIDEIRYYPPGERCNGGEIGKFILGTVKFRYLRGTYFSACTLYIVNACVYSDFQGLPRTLLSFHSAARYEDDQLVSLSPRANGVMQAYYPQKINEFLDKNHCLDSLNFTNKCSLTGSQLIKMGFKDCEKM